MTQSFEPRNLPNVALRAAQWVVKQNPLVTTMLTCFGTAGNCDVECLMPNSANLLQRPRLKHGAILTAMLPARKLLNDCRERVGSVSVN